MTMKEPYKRRDLAKTQPKFLGQYHELVMTNNRAAYEEFLEEYRPGITAEEKKDLLDDFTLHAESVLRLRWLRSR
jgi:hypothetical protein